MICGSFTGCLSSLTVVSNHKMMSCIQLISECTATLQKTLLTELKSDRKHVKYLLKITFLFCLDLSYRVPNSPPAQPEESYKP